MDYPVKPWEMAANSNLTTPAYVPNTDRLHSSPIPFPGTGGGGSAANVPPPLPPRPNETRPIYSAYNRSSMMPFNSYSSPYSNYGGYGGGYSPYSPSPYNSYGYGGGGMYGNRPYYDGAPGGELSFSQLAEESSASAFQSIESFVSAFGSISMMLESTFHALYSSFGAVVGVADHLGRVKQVFSALAIFRFFRWVWRRVLYLIGISKIKPETIESLWSEASNLNVNGLEDPKNLFMRGEPNKPSSWPIMMFLGFICAGPYLMWKLIKSLNLDGSQTEQHTKWAHGEIEHFIAEVKYPFNATSDREINLKPGQTIRLAPAKFQPSNVRGWALATDGSKVGLVPLNYIKVLGKRSGNQSSRLINNVTTISNEDLITSQTPHILPPTSTSRPRVRFDLNPRPAEPENSTTKSEHELTGILVKNDNTSHQSNIKTETDDQLSSIQNVEAELKLSYA